MKRYRKSWILVIVLTLLVAGTAWVSAHLDGAPPGHTGAPGEGTCAEAGCHDTPPSQVFGSTGFYRTNARRGDTLLFSVIVYRNANEIADSVNWGFEATVLDTFGAAAGQLVVVDSARTQLVEGASERTYITHTGAGSVNQSDLKYELWQVGWLMPDDTSCSPAIGYVAGVVGNVDGTADGDAANTSIQFLREECPIQLPGDVNLSGTVTSADIIAMLYIFKPGKGLPQPCEANGDVNCDGKNTAADIIYLVNYVFKGTGPPPCDICDLICQGVWSCF